MKKPAPAAESAVQKSKREVKPAKTRALSKSQIAAQIRDDPTPLWPKGHEVEEEEEEESPD